MAASIYSFPTGQAADLATANGAVYAFLRDHNVDELKAARAASAIGADPSTVCVRSSNAANLLASSLNWIDASGGRPDERLRLSVATANANLSGPAINAAAEAVCNEIGFC